MGRAMLLRATIAITMMSGSLAGDAGADIIGIRGSQPDGTEMTGATFVGEIEYSGIESNVGTLDITLTNTSPIDVGGFLTGFTFNFDTTDELARAILLATDTDFLDTGRVAGSPFGDFLAGAALRGSFLDGGNPNDGLAVGQTGHFTFRVLADDAGSLAASSFLDGPNEFNFVARFRGLEADGSDKIPAQPTSKDPVPAPGPLALTAAAGLLLLHRRR